MTNMEMKAIRMQAEAMTSNGSYQLRNCNGTIVAFDLTLERAIEYSLFYVGSKIEKMS